MEKDFKSKLDYALTLADMGFHVFPVKENAKKPPLINDFPNRATRDKKQITEWFSNGHSKSNIGISTTKFNESEALIVIDIDTKNGQMGESEKLQLELEGVDFETTLEQSTPSGARHLIYTAENPVGQHKLSKAIDVRSDGGYILGEGSTVDGKGYKLNNQKIARAHKTVVAKCGKPSVRAKSERPIPVREEIKTAESRAREYLTTAEPAVEGSGGDQQAYIVAAKLKDFGCTINQAFDLMSELWNPNCVPEWNPEELKTKINNAYEYGQNPIGTDAPETEFPDDLPKEEPTIKRRGLFGEKYISVEPNVNQNFLVEDTLAPNAMTVVYGESNSGKTFFALDLSLHIALGQPWNNRPTSKGLVIYVAAEGGWGIKKRIKAFREYHKTGSLDVPFVLVPCPIDLLNPRAHVEELSRLIKGFEVEYQLPTALVVIDTLARAIGGGNENAAQDMGAFVKNLDAIRTNTSGHIMVIHHSGKDTAKGARGHSSLRAATDTEIEVANLTATVTKQRDMAYGDPFGFRLEIVTVGKDRKGKAITSCVVLPSNTSAASDFSKEPLAVDSLPDRGLKALLAAIEWAGIPAPNDLDLEDGKLVVALDDFKKSFIDMYYSSSPKASQRSAFIRALSALHKLNYVNKNDMYVWEK